MLILSVSIMSYIYDACPYRYVCVCLCVSIYQFNIYT